MARREVAVKRPEDAAGMLLSYSLQDALERFTYWKRRGVVEVEFSDAPPSLEERGRVWEDVELEEVLVSPERTLQEFYRLLMEALLEGKRGVYVVCNSWRGLLMFLGWGDMERRARGRAQRGELGLPGVVSVVEDEEMSEDRILLVVGSEEGEVEYGYSLVLRSEEVVNGF